MLITFVTRDDEKMATTDDQNMVLALQLLV